MNHNGYFAMVLDKQWCDVVKRNATMSDVKSDHITIAYKPNDENYQKLLPLIGKRANAYINEYRANENIEAFMVDLICYNSYSLTEEEQVVERVDDGLPHITISHKKGMRPGEADTLFTNPLIKEKRVGYVEGTFRWIPFLKVVVNNK